MSSVLSLKFCIQCGDKRIREVANQLDQLFSVRELQPDKCGLCHKLITDESEALDVNESFTQFSPNSVSLREHDILEQSGVSLKSKGDQSVIPVLLNVIKQLGKSVVQITHQYGGSGSLDSFVTLTDVVSDDQKDDESSLNPKTSDSKLASDQENVHGSQGNIRGGNAELLPNAHDLQMDSVDTKENLTLHESQLSDDHVSTHSDEALATHCEDSQSRKETNVSLIKSKFNADVDECNLKDVLDPQIFSILNITSEGYIVCKLCPFQCVLSGLGIRKLLNHTSKEHPNLPVFEKPYRCPRCGFKDRLRVRIAMHMTSCGVTEKPFKCQVCSKGFLSITSLRLHIKIGRHWNKGRPPKIVLKKRGERGRPRKSVEEKEDVKFSFAHPQMQVLNKGKKRKRDSKEESVKGTKRQRANKGNNGLAISPSEKVIEKISPDLMDTSQQFNTMIKQTPTVVLKPLSPSKLGASPCLPTTAKKTKTNKPGVHGSKGSKKKTSKFIDDLQNILDTRVYEMIHPKSDYTNSIVCKVCFEPFLARGHSFITFLTHISEHTKTPCIEEPYVCRDCGLSFSRKVFLRAHFEKLHGDEMCYDCQVCGKQYAFRNGYLKHMHKVHSNVQIDADIVDGDEVFVKPDVDDLSVVLHRQILDMVHKDCDFTTSLVCKVCKESFRTTATGIKHFTWHVCSHKGIDAIDKPYKCPYVECDQIFGSSIDLKWHYTNAHKRKASLRCLYCPESFDSFEILKKHVSVHLKNEWEDVVARMRIDEEEGTDYVGVAVEPRMEPDVGNYDQEEQIISYESEKLNVSETEKAFNDDLSVVLVANLKAMVHEECNMKESIVCRLCRSLFQTGDRAIRQFAKHVAEHTGEPVITAVYQCSDCPERFRGLLTLESHWITAHEKDEERIGSDASDDDDVVDGEKLSGSESNDDIISDYDKVIKEIGKAIIKGKEKEQFMKSVNEGVSWKKECKDEPSVEPKFQSCEEQKDHDESSGEAKVQSSIEQEYQNESSAESSIQRFSEEQESQDELSAEPKFKSSKLAANLIPEVLEAIHKDCDLKKYIICKYCQQIFTNGGHGMTYFVKHIVQHTGKAVIEQPYLCSDCGKTFKRSFELYQHTIYCHNVDGNYSCQHCGKSYPKRNSLYKHMRDVHRTTVASKEAYIMCELCGKEVKKRNLKSHASIHTGVFDIHCEVPGCTFKTNYKKNLNQHVAHVHNKPKSDLCRYCGLSFPLQGALAAHEQKHINNEPVIFKKHQCSYCGFSADKINDLKKHERRHKNEFRFKCTDCEKKFISRRDCVRHILFCQKKQGLPVTNTPCPIDLFVRKRKSKYDQQSGNSVIESEPPFPVALEQVQEELAAEETITVATLDNIPLTTVGTDNNPAVEIATAIANLQYMQSQ